MQCIFWMIQCRAQNHKENRRDQKAKLRRQKTDQWLAEGLCLTTKRKKGEILEYWEFSVS